MGTTRSLNGSYRGIVREQRSDDDLERQKFERLTNVNENNEPDIKPEPDESPEGEDPNLVCHDLMFPHNGKRLTHLR